MAITKSQIKQYLLETLGTNVSPKNWQPSRRLPLFLRDGYTYYEAEILGADCLLMADREPNRSAATVRKHVEQVRGKWDGDIIYVRQKANSDERRRLIEQKIPFIVPGNQMYLPFLGIDFREHFRRLHEKGEVFSPASQAAILLLLTDKQPKSYTTQELADRLGYSKMTASRSLNELKAKDIGAVSLEGRQRLLTLGDDRRTLWERALPMLSSPVKHRQYIRPPRNRRIEIKAGLTALAHYSMLAAPPVPVVAVTSEQWSSIDDDANVAPAEPNDPKATEVEVWSYDPALFAEDQVVDRLSLFLSLKDNEDERVESALDEMMEAMSW